MPLPRAPRSRTPLAEGRIGRAVLVAAAVGAACGDPSGPRADSTDPGQVGARLRIATTPAAATLTQIGLDLTVSMRDSSTLTFDRLLVDSGTVAERDESNPFADLRFTSGPRVRLVAFAPGAGTHRFTVVVKDAQGQAVSASITRTFDIPDVSYAVTMLPDLGAGAGVRWVNAKGDVAGWVQSPDGPKRPAVWIGGTLRVVPVVDATTNGGVLALRVNTSGDVLLGPAAWPYVDGQVVRNDGATMRLGPVSYLPNELSPFPYTCCRAATDLNDRRQALGTTDNPLFGEIAHSVIIDVATGALTDVPHLDLTTLNNAGQAAGFVATGGSYRSLVLVTRGFTLPPFPEETRAGYCDTAGRFTFATPVDLDDSANLLAGTCGAYVLFYAGGTSLWADRFVGLGQAHLSRQGGIVASLDGAGSIFLWRLGTSRSSRLRLADDAWRVDSLAAVNETGALAVHAVERATGRGAALLLRPLR